MSHEAAQSQLVPHAPSAFGFSGSQRPGERLVLRQLLLQAPLTPEALAVAAAVRTSGLLVSLAEASLEDLPRVAHQLADGACLPVGTPEFMRIARAVAGIPPTEWVRCPNQLSAFLLHPTRCVNVSAALAMRRPLIISPYSGAAFSPFLLSDRDALTDTQARAELTRLLQLPTTTPVYAAAAHDILAIWRYYVIRGEVTGFARYAQLQGAAGMGPNVEDVSAMIASIPDDTAYALDVGLLRDGATTLLGVQDPLDVQLLPTGNDRPSNYDFLRMLWVRWREVVTVTRDTGARLAHRRREREPEQRLARRVSGLDEGDSCGRMNT